MASAAIAAFSVPAELRVEKTRSFYGLSVFSDEWSKAICMHSEWPVHFFVPLGQMDAAERAIAAWPGGAGSRCLVFPLDDFPRACSRTDYVAVHCPLGPRIGSLGSVVHCASPTPVPVTVTHHSVSYPMMLDMVLQQLLGDVRPWDAIVCPSHASMAAHKAIVTHLSSWVADVHGITIAPQNRWRVIPHGVDIARYQPLAKSIGRQVLGLPEDAILLLAPGRIATMDKADLLPLLRVVSELDGRVHLAISGADSNGSVADLRRFLQPLGLSARVHVFTDVPPALMVLLYQAADVAVFVYDNVQESFGMAITEAMACGLPCIVSAWNGLREVVVDGEDGYHIPTYYTPTARLDQMAEMEELHAANHLRLAQVTAIDLRALRDVLERLVADPPRIAAMSAKAREHARAEYAWDKVIAKYENLWVECKEEARRSAYRTNPGPRFPLSEIFRHYGAPLPEDFIVSPERPAIAWESCYSRFPDLPHAVSRHDVAAILTGPGRADRSPELSQARAWALKHGYIQVAAP